MKGHAPGSPFDHCYLDAYYPTGRFHTVVVKNNGVVRGFLPIVETRPGVRPIAIRRIRPAANYFTWEFDLIHGQGDRAEVVAATSQALDSWRGWDVFACEVALDSGAFPMLSASLQSKGAVARPPGAIDWLDYPLPAS